MFGANKSNSEVKSSPTQPSSGIPPHHQHDLIKPAEDLLKKTPKRVKGISRKFLLRTINRRIVVRLARRASIGIPLLGFYFAQNTFRSDLNQALSQENPPHVRLGYKIVTAIDGVDLTAQTFMISGLVSTLYFQNIDFSMINFPEIMKYADKVSIGCAFASTLLGTYIELKREHDLELSAEESAATHHPPNNNHESSPSSEGK